MGYYHNINKIVNISLFAYVAEIRILLHVSVLHMDANIENNSSVFNFADDARAANLLTCS
jgi:hypothetical protein